MKLHEFKAQLQYVDSGLHEDFWQAVYTKMFPDLLLANPNASGNTQSQKLGIDRIIHLRSGKTLYIDEKLRRQKWEDFLLEYISDDVRHTPGWMEKDLLVDYIAYAFMATEQCYMLNWHLLRRAWRAFKTVWLSQYKTIEAENNGYNTLSVAVPIDVVLSKIKTAGIINIERN